MAKLLARRRGVFPGSSSGSIKTLLPADAFKALGSGNLCRCRQLACFFWDRSSTGSADTMFLGGGISRDGLAAYNSDNHGGWTKETTLGGFQGGRRGEGEVGLF